MADQLPFSKARRCDLKRMMLLALLVAAMPLATVRAQEGQDEKGSSEEKLTGCLEATPEGGYFIRDGSGRAFEIAGKASKLSRHVNHKVTLTGRFEVNDVEIGGANSHGTQAERRDRYFRLERIEHVAESCMQ
jgi:hypothetical protein